MFMLALSVAKVVKCMLGNNYKCTLVFNFLVAEVAKVAGFLRVRGVGYNCAWIVGSKNSKMHIS